VDWGSLAHAQCVTGGCDLWLGLPRSVRSGSGRMVRAVPNWREVRRATMLERGGEAMRSMRRGLLVRTLVVSLIACGALSAESTAAPVTYTDEAAFLAAVNSLGYTTISEGFESAAWDVTRPDGLDGSLTTQGITWDASDLLRTIAPWARSGSYGVFDSFGDPDVMSLDIVAGPAYAIGGYFTGISATIDFNIGGQVAGTFTLSDTHSFCGVLDTDGFTSLTIAARSGHWGADDFTVAIPEPATLSLLALGGLALLRRRRNK